MSPDTLWDRAQRAAESIRQVDDRQPWVALVLGSGLGAYADSLAQATHIPYEDIPGFPVSTVSGHSGTLVMGEVDGLVVAAMQGRVHLYEGHTAQDVVFPLRALGLLGASYLIITNASGGLGEGLEAGDLMLIVDQLNLSGTSPLVGDNDERFGPRFPDMSEPYDPELAEVARAVAKDLDIDLKEGVYAGVLGPTYETPAEVRMMATLGADAVGMSTVCEVIAARHMGLRVLGVSCISNLASGLSDSPLTHEEVEDTANQVRETFQKLVDGVLRQLAAGENLP
jgi:purine-nucleoside phosphorylase